MASHVRMVLTAVGAMAALPMAGKNEGGTASEGASC